MPTFHTQLQQLSKPVRLALVIIGVVLVLLILVAVVWSTSSSSKQKRLVEEQARLAETERVYRKQVRRLELRRRGADGEEEVLEVLLTGHVNIYDTQGNLKKGGIQGFYKVDNLLDTVNRLLDSDEGTYSSVPISGCSILVETNSGIVYLPCEDHDDLVEDIEDVVDETLNPTPTPIPIVTPTPIPPSVTPGPSPTPGPATPTPTPTLPGPSPTPTPLPDYLTAPPFTCEEYEALGRPVAISGTICGAD